jgi:LytS/YehU family sensor histidine kinase
MPGDVHWLAVSGFSIVYTFVYWNISRFIMIYTRTRYPQAQQIRKRLLMQIAMIVGMVLLVCSLLAGAEALLLPGGGHSSLSINPLRVYLGTFFTTLLCFAIYESICFFLEWKHSLIEKEEVKQAHLQSQLDQLKAQVNPHFLFNSLNTLAQLIPENQALSVRFVQHLAEVYRYNLDMQTRDLVTLAEELEALESYLFLMRIRFGEGVQVRVSIPEAQRGLRLPPLVLQMLLENAVKHNATLPQSPLVVSISVEQGSLLVRNNLQPRKYALPSTRKGLENINRRCRLLTGQEIRVLRSAQDFSVLVPLPLPALPREMLAA